MNNKQYADLQINGYMGVDFSAPDLTEEQFLTTADNIFKSGTNYFLPTIVTSSKEVYLHNLVIISNLAPFFFFIIFSSKSCSKILFVEISILFERIYICLKAFFCFFYFLFFFFFFFNIF